MNKLPWKSNSEKPTEWKHLIAIEKDGSIIDKVFYSRATHKDPEYLSRVDGGCVVTFDRIVKWIYEDELYKFLLEDSKDETTI